MSLGYLAVAGAVFGVNLLPAFGPPTWAVLVLFKLNWHLNAVALVGIGAVSAASGRLLLAHGTRLLRRRFSARRLASLQAVGDYLSAHRGRAVLGLALFAVSPVPSAQLFEGAGLLDAPLLPLTAAFFAGRLVSYSLYVGVASLAQHSLGSLIGHSLTSWYGIIVQVLMLGGVVLLARIDWSRWLPAGRGRPPSTVDADRRPVGTGG